MRTRFLAALLTVPLLLTGCGIPFLTQPPARTIQQTVKDDEKVLEQIRTTITRNTSYTEWGQTHPASPLYPCTEGTTKAGHTIDPDGNTTTDYAWATTSTWRTPSDELKRNMNTIQKAVGLILAQYGIPQKGTGLSMTDNDGYLTIVITASCAPVNPAL